MKLREQFEKETCVAWINTQGEPDIEYVEWLETKLQNTSSNSDYAKSCDFCADKSEAEFNICQPCLDRLISEGN